MKTVKIYGLGWVGRAMLSVFPNAWVHDPALGLVEDRVADVAFVCVPTPNRSNSKPGVLDTSIVEQVVKDAPEEFIIIRSTVNPGTSDYLAGATGKTIVTMPEYLGETTAHPLFNEGERRFLIIGGQPYGRRAAIELFQSVYNANITIRQVTNYEAEVIKLSENRAIFWKVMQCQELYDACQLHRVDYYTIRDAVYGDDPRFDLWFSFVYPDARGANSKCIPKDVYAWNAWAESAPATSALLTYNEGLINAVDNN